MKNMKHYVTRDAQEFLRWVPEVSGLIFQHLKVKGLQLTVEGPGDEDVTFEYRRDELGNSGRVFEGVCPGCGSLDFDVAFGDNFHPGERCACNNCGAKWEVTPIYTVTKTGLAQ